MRTICIYADTCFSPLGIIINGLEEGSIYVIESRYNCFNWLSCFFGHGFSFSLSLSLTRSINWYNKISSRYKWPRIKRWFKFHYVLFVCWFYGTFFEKKVEQKTKICGHKQKWHYHLTFIHCSFTSCTPYYFVKHITMFIHCVFI